MFKGFNVKDSTGESVGNIIEVACAKEAGDGQAHFVIGTDTNQLINI